MWRRMLAGNAAETFQTIEVESFRSQQWRRRSRLHSKRSLRVVKPFLTHFSSLWSFLFLGEFPAWPFFGKPFFGTRQYCREEDRLHNLSWTDEFRMHAFGYPGRRIEKYGTKCPFGRPFCAILFYASPRVTKACEIRLHSRKRRHKLWSGSSNQGD